MIGNAQSKAHRTEAMVGGPKFFSILELDTIQGKTDWENVWQ